MSSLPTTQNTDRPLAMGYGAKLDDTYLRILNNEENPVQIQFAELEPPRVRTSEDPEDSGAPEFGSKFARSDFTGGEGLDFAHRVSNPANYRSRFWDSKNLDIAVPNPGEQRDITLASQVEKVIDISSADVDIAYFNDNLFATDGTDVLVSSDFLSASPTTSTEATGSTQAISSLVAQADHLYAACGSDGIRRRDTSGTWASWSTQTSNKIWAAKNRIIAANTDELYEAASGGGDVLLATLRDGYEWTSVTDLEEGIAAASSAGDIWIFVVNETGDLELSSQIPLYNDIPVAILGYRGIVFYITEQESSTGRIIRFWTAQFQQGSFVNIQLRRQWGLQSSPLADRSLSLEAHHAQVYLGIPESSGTYLWKYDIETEGRVRDKGSTDTDKMGTVRRVLSISGTLFYSIDNQGVIRESDNYEESGYLISPLIDFFDSRRKSWAAIDIDLPTLTDGQLVEVFYSTDPSAINDPDDPSWSQLVKVENVAPADPTRLRQVNSRYLAIMVKLYRGDTSTLTPSFRSFSVLAYPAETDLLVRVPVNVSDRIERLGRKATIVKGLGTSVYNFLHSKHGESVIFNLFRPEENIVGTITNISEVVPYINKVRGTVTYISTVTIRGRRVESEISTFSTDLVGIGTTGIVRMGGDS